MLSINWKFVTPSDFVLGTDMVCNPVTRVVKK